MKEMQRLRKQDRYDKKRVSVAMNLIDDSLSKKIDHRYRSKNTTKLGTPEKSVTMESSVFDSQFGNSILGPIKTSKPKKLRMLNLSMNEPMIDKNIKSIISTFRKSQDTHPLNENKMSIHEKFNACITTQRHNEHEFRGFKGEMDTNYRSYLKDNKGSPVKYKPKLDIQREHDIIRFNTSS